MDTLLKNCRLIPELSAGTGGSADVLISDGIIASVSGAGSGLSADRTFDCTGMTLLPGLFDLHTHMNWAYHLGEIRLNDFTIFREAMKSARLFLDNGITTIRDMGSPRRVASAVKSAIAEGLCLGPRMFTGGLIITPVNRPGDPDPYNFLRFVSGCDDMIRIVREEVGGGADYIKLYTPILPEEMETAVMVAKAYHRPVAVHAHDLEYIRMCIDKGVDTIEHGSYIDDGCIERLMDGRIHLVPTLAVLSPLVGTPGFPTERKAALLAPLLKANSVNITKAYKAGLKLGFGTDTPIEEIDRVPGIEFRMRSEHCGMKNVDMLLQATRYSAEILGIGDVTGTVREGLCADLILVSGRPDEDISVMYRKPEMVFAGGKLHIPGAELKAE